LIPEEKIIVALDMQAPIAFRIMLETLQSRKIWIKIGMELFYSMGPSCIEEAKAFGFNVFLDLKLHDIPTTVEKALTSLMKYPIDMVNIHAAGGSEMMKKAAEVVKNSDHKPKLIAVTQLTSTTQPQMNAEQKIVGKIHESVINYAKLAKLSGCDGVVCSPHEISLVKASCGPSFLTVTPGIRPLGTDVNDQQRVTTPMDAIRMGTDYMVIGRPITQNQSPLLALMKILKEEE
jgi:orotidine-5'-phosphate decarboxylase